MLRERGTDVLAAPIHAADRLEQLVGGVVFGEIARRPGPECAHRPLVLGMHAQHQHAHRRVFGAEPLQRVEKWAARHRDVEQHEIGHLAIEAGKQLVGVRRFAGDDEPGVRFHDAPQPLSHDRMIVRDEDPNHDSPTGIVTTIDVPSPGFPCTISTPPQANARSRIPTRPSDRNPLRELGVNPTPLSATPRMSAFPAQRTDTSTRVALAWRVTLVSASWMIRNAWLAIRSGSRGNSWPTSSLTSMPVRRVASWTRYSIAASRPSWSSTLGRSSLAMRRTISIVASIRVVID